MSSGLVSIIIRTYYRNELLPRAIDSALNQTYENIEIIVVDDSGEGHAENVATEYSDVKFIYHDENKGPIEPWHTGFAAARGEFIQFLDDDDWLSPTKIQKGISILENSSCGVVYCNIREVDNDQIVRPEYNMSNDFLREVLSFNSYPCQTSSMLIRSDPLNDVFPLNNYSGGTDIVLQLELTRQTTFCHLEEVLVNRPTNHESLGFSVDTYIEHLNIINDYSDMYDNYPERFKSEVIASRYRKLGEAYLHNQIWSSAAVRAFAKAVYIYPGINTLYIQLLIASLLGKAGLYFGSFFKRKGYLNTKK